MVYTQCLDARVPLQLISKNGSSSLIVTAHVASAGTDGAIPTPLEQVSYLLPRCP